MTVIENKIANQLKEWFVELFTLDPEKQVYEHFLINPLPDNPYDKREGYRCQFYTRTHKYIIDATNDYLMASCLNRKPRAGEDWQRGCDLSSGKFNQEVWNKIKHDIIRNELVKISKIILEEQKPIWHPTYEGVRPEDVPKNRRLPKNWFDDVPDSTIQNK